MTPITVCGFSLRKPVLVDLFTVLQPNFFLWHTLTPHFWGTSWHHSGHVSREIRSEALRRDAEELRFTAQRLIKEAAQLLEKSLALEEKIARNGALSGK